MGNGNLIAGAILIATAALISLTGIGLLISIPLGIFGFLVMFPSLLKYGFLAFLLFIAYGYIVTIL